jgi:hypothetical protein
VGNEAWQQFAKAEAVMREAIEAMGKGRSQSLALTKLDECRLWVQDALASTPATDGG